MLEAGGTKEADSVAATLRPEAGWDHPAGRPLEEARLGDRTTGRVTNTLNRRVWVDIGYAKDATFQAAREGTFLPGDELKDLVITNVDHERGFIILRPPEVPNRRRTESSGRSRTTLDKPRTSTSVAVAPSASAPDTGLPGVATSDAPVLLTPAPDTAASAVVDTRSAPRSRSSRKAVVGATERQSVPDAAMPPAKRKESWRVAAAPKPKGGWIRGEGRLAADFQVGEVVQGRVTNSFYQRIWVNIGAKKDISFLDKRHTYKVGDEITGLRITEVNTYTDDIYVQRASTP